MPEVIDAPAHPNNYGHYGRANTPRALVFHTAEELADDREVTPLWFANPAAQASAHVYADSDGDLYVMVPDEEPAWACGTRGGVNRHWYGAWDTLPPWGEAGVSNNCLSLSIEIEGRAFDLAMPEPQYQTVLAWAREKIEQYAIPIDRVHLVGHGDLATDRTDPGPYFPWERLIADLKEGGDVRAVALDQAETLEAFNRLASRMGGVMFDDAGETMEKVVDPLPPDGYGRVVVTYKL